MDSVAIILSIINEVKNSIDKVQENKDLCVFLASRLVMIEPIFKDQNLSSDENFRDLVNNLKDHVEKARILINTYLSPDNENRRLKDTFNRMVRFVWKVVNGNNDAKKFFDLENSIAKLVDDFHKTKSIVSGNEKKTLPNILVVVVQSAKNDVVQEINKALVEVARGKTVIDDDDVVEVQQAIDTIGQIWNGADMLKPSMEQMKTYVMDSIDKIVSLSRTTRPAGSSLSVFPSEEKDIFADFELSDERQEGSCGVMRKATYRPDRKKYALKRVNMCESWQSYEVIQREAGSLRQLCHPNIVGYYYSFFSNERCIFNLVMELVLGKTLREYTREPSPRPDGQEVMLKWLRQLTSALAYMHGDRRLVHRDLKPENIMITLDMEDVKIVDFGLARNLGLGDQTAAAEIQQMTAGAGTLRYMSYEKIRGRNYDGRDDVWAVGCIFLELILPHALSNLTLAVDDEERNKQLANLKNTDHVLKDVVYSILEHTLQEHRPSSVELLLLLEDVKMTATASTVGLPSQPGLVAASQENAAPYPLQENIAGSAYTNNAACTVPLIHLAAIIEKNVGLESDNKGKDGDAMSDSLDTATPARHYDNVPITNVQMLSTDPIKLSFDNTTLKIAIELWFSDTDKAQSQYGPIETWDVTSITDTSFLFVNRQNFNRNINAWNMSNVTNMSSMFSGASSFNQPLESWNVSNVTNMSWMFSGASSFNQPLESWNVSNVTGMSWMFSGASSFNQPLNRWNVSSVEDMSGLFYEASSFNQPLDLWDVSIVKDMSGLFYAASSFNQPLDHWIVSNVTNMSGMFSGASLFNQPLNTWIVSNVTDMSGMFCDALLFNQPLGFWCVSNVIDMSEMFKGASSFNQPLEGWNVSNVTNMYHMFFRAMSFNQPLNTWFVGRDTIMFEMFREASSYNQPLCSWNVSSVPNMFERTSSFHDESISSVIEPFVGGMEVMQPMPSVASIGGLSGLIASDIMPIVDDEKRSAANEEKVKEDYGLTGDTDAANQLGKARDSFNEDIIQWTKTDIKNSSQKLCEASPLNHSLNGLTGSKTTPMLRMISASPLLNHPLDCWKSNHATNISRVHQDVYSLNWSLNDLDLSNCKHRSDIFSGASLCTQLPERRWTSISASSSLEESRAESVTDLSVKGSTDLTGTNSATSVSLLKSLSTDETIALLVDRGCRPDLGEKVAASGEMYTTTDTHTLAITGELKRGVDAACSAPSVALLMTNEEDTTKETHTLTVVDEPIDGVDVVCGVRSASVSDTREDEMTNDSGALGLIDSNASLRSAVKLWFSDQNQAIRTYGLIGKWKLTEVTDTSYLFKGQRLFNEDISKWNMSNVTDMSGMFDGASLFNQPLSTWNVSRVATMIRIFAGASSFNQPLDTWDVSNVRHMTSVFQGALSFNQSLGTWNVSNVTNMSGLFWEALSFNQSLHTWIVNNVTDMSCMFLEASSFNQPLDRWDVSNVTNMAHMFQNAVSFNQSLNNWVVSNGTNVSNVFFGATSFNLENARWAEGSSIVAEREKVRLVVGSKSSHQSSDVREKGQRTATVKRPLTNASLRRAVAMWFDDQAKAEGEYGPIGKWDLTGVTDTSLLFRGRASFNVDISEWNMSNVTDMSHMFNGAESFNQPLVSWNVSNVTNMTYMLVGTSSFNQPLNGWDVSNVTNMSGMFYEASLFNQPLDSWNVSKVFTMFGLFYGAVSFSQELSTWDVSNVRNMSHAFRGASSFNCPLDRWDVSNVTNMSRMFQNAVSFNQPLDSWNVNNVTEISHIFTGATLFHLENARWAERPAAVDERRGLQLVASSDTSSIVGSKPSHQSSDVREKGQRTATDKRPLTNESLRRAVAMWFDDQAKAEGEYGPIGKWDLTGVTDTSQLFQGRASFNVDISEWNMSNVTDMSRMFKQATSFNQPLDSWNVSNATTMVGMFYEVTSFNQPLNGWDVSNVRDMSHMFQNAVSFNQSLNNWVVSNCTYVSCIFFGATSFNLENARWAGTPAIVAEGRKLRLVVGSKSSHQSSDVREKGQRTATDKRPLTNESLRRAVAMWFDDQAKAEDEYGPIGEWDLTGVTDTSKLFQGRASFNVDISEWNMSNVTDMSRMFKQATSFNQPLDKWNVSNATTMVSMFLEASSFNQPLNGWDVSNVRDMSHMFHGATSFNQPLDLWKANNVTNMSYMFDRALSFNQQIYICEGGSVRDITYMFKGAASFNQPLNRWNLCNVTNMSHMFYRASSFNQPLDSWNVSNATTMFGMFYVASSFNQPLDSWNVSNVRDMSHMFHGASSFNQSLNNWVVSNRTNVSNIFFGATSFNLENARWAERSAAVAKREKVRLVVGSKPSHQSSDVRENGRRTATVKRPLTNESLRRAVAMWFDDQAKAEDEYGPIGKWDLTGVTDTSKLFQGRASFNVDISEWNTSNVTNMSEMFYEASSFNQPLDKWDVSNVRSMSSMFSRTSMFNQSLDSWNVSNVTNMSWMFYGASKFNQPLNNWDVSNVKNMTCMFWVASSFNQPLDRWRLSNVTTLSGMFWGAKSFNQPLNAWDVSNVRNMSHMFEGASSFNQPLNTWNVNNVRKMSYMFEGASSFRRGCLVWYRG